MSRSNLYIRLAGELEKKIGSMQIGEILPPEQALADEFRVSKPTVRRALTSLADNGLIRKINGVGSVVSGSVRVIPKELVFLCHDVVFFGEAITGFSSCALENNYLASVVPLHGDRDSQERIISTVIARNPAGIAVYTDPQAQNLPAYRKPAELNLPAVHLIRLPGKLDGDLLSFDSENEIAGIIGRFYAEGCRKFALYGDSHVNALAAVERSCAFFAGLKKLRLVPREELICRDGDREERFLELFRDEKTRPDAVVCLNDHCAGNLIRKLMRRRIGFDDVRMSGFDHSPMTAFLPHALLTVEPPMRELGEEAARMLIRRIENPGFNAVRKRLSSRIVEAGNRRNQENTPEKGADGYHG